MIQILQNNRWWLIYLIILTSAAAHAQVSISGLVTDEQDGLPLIGANIIIKNTTRGTLTDFDGKFTLEARDANATLVISYLGYISQEVPLAGRTYVEVELSQSARTLDEVVVVGFGVQRKSDVTGSVATVRAEELQKIPSGDFTQALQGKVAGLEVIGSGVAGAGGQLQLRGPGTFGLDVGNAAGPIFVVDGVMLDDPGNISANEIESVEVLKDGAAVAIYGSRGANGVILITTKRGFNSDKAVFSLNTSYSMQQVAQRINLVGPRDYATLSNEAAMNQGLPIPFPDLNQIGPGTDWQDVVFRNAPMYSINLSARGGDNKFTYYISGEAFKQDGILQANTYDRYTLRINNDYKMTSFLKVGHNLAFNFDASTFPPGNLIFNAYGADPTVTARAEDGTWGNTSVRSNVGNPLAQLEYNTNNRNKRYRALGNLYAEAYITPDITFRSSIGFDWHNTSNFSFTPEFFVTPQQQQQESQLFVANGNLSDWQWENTLSYNKSFGKHRFGGVLGYLAQSHQSQAIFASRFNLIGTTDELLFLTAGTEDGASGQNLGQFYRYLSYVGRVNYTFDDRYIIMASLRRDGSSKFGRNNRFGNFPAISAAWRLSQEEFINDLGIFDNLKLRAGFGVTGNDRIDYRSIFSVVNNGLFAVFGKDPNEMLNFGATVTGVANPFLQWEETRSTNIGLEMGYLKNRLTFELDYYINRTDKVLVRVPIPSYVGSDQDPNLNAADIENRGIEWNINWRDKVGKVYYSIGAIGTTQRNRVLNLGDNKEEILGGGTPGGLATRTVVDGEIGAFWGYRVIGVYQNQADIDAYPNIGNVRPGDLIFEDVNGDGIISPEDRTLLGSAIPRIMYGFNGSIEYSGFDLSIDFYGVWGNKILNSKKMARFFGAPNFEESFLDRWNGEGTSDFEPRVTNGGYPNYEVSDRFLEDGSYFRIRSLVIGYNIANRWSQRIGMDKLRVAFSLINPMIWTAYSGYSPEIGGSPIARGIDAGAYPVPKTWTFGVNATF